MQNFFSSIDFKKEFDKFNAASKKMINDMLRKMFTNQIKENFLIRILCDIQEDSNYKQNYHKWFEEYFPEGLPDTVANDFNIKKEICNYIVGSHSSRTILKSKEEISILYSDNKYASLIKHDVFLALEIRTFAGKLYRKENLFLVDQLLYYPMMLKLFALINILGSKINEINDSVLNALLLNIWQKALGVFAMVDYGTLDNGYTMARGMIESYVTLITLYYFPNAKKKYNKFTEYKIDKLSQDNYSDEFLALYNKIDTKQVTINDYLNYGWYDDIIEFLYMQKNIRYTFSSMFRLHEMKNTISDSSLLEALYKRCHGFVHGNTIINKFHIICYIELSQILYLCLVPLCKILNIKAEVNSVDLIKELDDAYKNITNLKGKTLEMNLVDFYNEKYKIFIMKNIKSSIFNW